MRGLALVIVGLVSVAIAQTGRFTYRDSSGDLTVNGGKGKLTRLENGYRLNLWEQVTIASKSQGTTLKADVVEAVLTGGRALKVSTVTASKNFSMVKDLDGRSSKITGSQATLTSTAKGDKVVVSGPVTIVSNNSAARQSLNATGTKGEVTMLNADDKRGSIQSASLSGPIKVIMVELSKEGKSSKVTVTGDRMELTNQKTMVITVTGKVKISGDGESTVGTFTDLSKAVFTLNASGEIIGFETEAG